MLEGGWIIWGEEGGGREGKLAYPPLGQTKGNIWILFVQKKVENKAVVFSLVFSRGEEKSDTKRDLYFLFLNFFF